MRKSCTEEVNIMKSLIAYVRERALEYQTFTGAFIIKNGEVIWQDITSAEPDQDPLAHAELKALRGALAEHGPDLKGCHLYTTQRPCPMCASAAAWSGIERVVYGWAPSDHQWGTPERAQRFFAELKIDFVGPVLKNKCREIGAYLIANGI